MDLLDGAIAFIRFHPLGGRISPLAFIPVFPSTYLRYYAPDPPSSQSSARRSKGWTLARPLRWNQWYGDEPNERSLCNPDKRLDIG